MSGASLAREMNAAVTALSDADLEMLVGYGIDRTDVVVMGMVGAALVRVEGDHYCPYPEGKKAFLTPARVHCADTPESPVPDSAVRVGNLVDIVAWHPLRPDRWAMRVGSAEWLGCIEPQYQCPDPVPIRRSVLAWLQSGCAGLLALSRSTADIYRLLICCTGGVIAEDYGHAAELRRFLAHPRPAPAVSVAAGDRRHAA
jgi:hypothetical protein